MECNLVQAFGGILLCFVICVWV